MLSSSPGRVKNFHLLPSRTRTQRVPGGGGEVKWSCCEAGLSLQLMSRSRNRGSPHPLPVRLHGASRTAAAETADLILLLSDEVRFNSSVYRNEFRNTIREVSAAAGVVMDGAVCAMRGDNGDISLHQRAEAG
jgi:hypothetical protein